MDVLHKKAYYKENTVYPEVVGIKLIVFNDKLNCLLPCVGSNDCSCFSGWDVTHLSDTNEVCG